MRKTIMNNTDNVFWGSKEDWLNSRVYIVKDILDDQFAIDFNTITIKDMISNGENVKEPDEFLDTIPF